MVARFWVLVARVGFLDPIDDPIWLLLVGLGRDGVCDAFDMHMGLLERLAAVGLKKKPSAKSRNAKLDALCRLLVLNRDGNRCRKCGQGYPQWAHVYSRRYLILRWNPMNSMALCAKCHFWWHDQPLEAANWWEKEVAPKIGTSRTELSERLRSGEKPNFEGIENFLKIATMYREFTGRA